MRDRREFLKLMLGGAVAATTVPMAGAVLRDSASSVRGKPSLRIVHIGDPQFGFCDGGQPERSGDRFQENYALDLASFKKVMLVLDKVDCDLVLISGDMTQKSKDVTKEAAGRVDAITDFRNIVSRHARVLTYPEGQTADAVNLDPSDYSDELGNKQFFAAKGWLSDALDLWLGMRIAKAGVSFHPMNDGRPFAVRGLSLRGRTLDVEMSGIGTNASYSLNGAALDGGFVSWGCLKPSSNMLKIKMQN